MEGETSKFLAYFTVRSFMEIFCELLGGVKNEHIRIRLTVREVGRVDHLGPDRKQMCKFFYPTFFFCN